VRPDSLRHPAIAAPGLNAPPGPAACLLLLVMRAYQVLLSPAFGGACRFYPSCSKYAMEAIAVHGARRGAWLALRRLLRCHPFSAGGLDPVPGRPEHRP
jgi:uncharacterized protein